MRAKRRIRCLGLPVRLAFVGAAALVLASLMGTASASAQPATLPGRLPAQQAGAAQASTVATGDRVTNPPPGRDQLGVAQPSAGQDDAVQAHITYKTPYEFFLTAITVGLAAFMATLLCVMGWRTGITEDFLRSFLVLIVVFAAMFLIVAGYTEKQTAPVFGLLGTIVGYMFGRLSSSPPTEKDKGERAPARTDGRSGPPAGETTRRRDADVEAAKADHPL